MSAILGAISKVLGVLRKILAAKQVAEKVTKKKISLVQLFTITFLLVTSVIVAITSAPSMIGELLWQNFLTKYFYMTEEEYQAWIDSTVPDAAGMLDVMNLVDYNLSESILECMDTDTFRWILGYVSAYNAEFHENVVGLTKVNYSYRQEVIYGSGYDLFQISPYTGNFLYDPSVFEIEGEDVYPLSVNEMWDSTKLRWSDIENAWNDGPEEGVLYDELEYVKWQPVVALCYLYIIEHSEEWGTYYTEEDFQNRESFSSYYIHEDVVKEILDLYTYEISLVAQSDGASIFDRISFDEFLDGSKGRIPFRLSSYTYMDGEDTVRNVHRVPVYAPAKISNSYISYDYEYGLERESVFASDFGEAELQYRVLKEVSYTVQPSRFVEAVKEIIPNFDKDLFVHLLRQLPYSGDIANYYEEVMFAADNEVIRQWTTDSADVSPSIGTVVSENGFNDFEYGKDDNGGMDMGSGTGFTVPLYVADGYIGGTYVNIQPYEGLEYKETEQGNVYGVFQITEGATRTLTVSDNLTYEQIERILESSKFLSAGDRALCPLVNTPEALDETIRCFLDYQERTGTSVCGLLAIMKQEGSIGTHYGRNAYNFFNITIGTTGFPAYVNSKGDTTRFRDYKTAVETQNFNSEYKTAAVVALEAQIDWVNNNYWSSPKYGQNTFYSMCFNGYMKNGAEGIDAYKTIGHSYCPPWDDNAMPYSADSYTVTVNKDGSLSTHYYWKKVNANYLGWVNRCGSLRETFEKLAAGY